MWTGTACSLRVEVRRVTFGLVSLGLVRVLRVMTLGLGRHLVKFELGLGIHVYLLERGMFGTLSDECG